MNVHQRPLCRVSGTITSDCKTIREFRAWLEEQVEFLENVLRFGPCHIRPDGQAADDMYTRLVIDELVEEAASLACRFGAGHLDRRRGDHGTVRVGACRQLAGVGESHAVRAAGNDDARRLDPIPPARR